MNTNPQANTVLCYGDSNTWGQKPDKTGRFPIDVRWTGRLQNQLGEAYRIIDEGLSSRTTDLDYGKKPGRNGKQYLIPCLASHNPLDMVLIMLGTNDYKMEFERSAQDIAAAVGGLVDDVRQYAVNAKGEAPKVLIVSPIHVDESARDFREFYEGVYDTASAAKSRELAQYLQAMANTKDCAFFDASTEAGAGSDGIHLSESAHSSLANALEGEVKKVIDK